ncbi:MAG: putative toxin-antitoxin system toxin component, PIN family [Defluviitaleaceae bacterium]|nr:putative toxin-antitoxin system toxin component, PIN family [Defluviitaleaceae bacterium]
MIKVLIDTNILVSAILNNQSVPNKAFQKAMNPPYHPLVSEQNIEELRRVFDRKFPDKIAMFERFVAKILPLIETITIPQSPHADEKEIRDIDDRPILRAAIKANIDIIVTGDKDFLESGLTAPKVMTASEFVKP